MPIVPTQARFSLNKGRHFQLSRSHKMRFRVESLHTPMGPGWHSGFSVQHAFSTRDASSEQHACTVTQHLCGASSVQRDLYNDVTRDVPSVYQACSTRDASRVKQPAAPFDTEASSMERAARETARSAGRRVTPCNISSAVPQLHPCSIMHSSPIDLCRERNTH